MGGAVSRNAEDCRWCRPLIDQPGGVLYPWICPGHECVGCGSADIVYENCNGQLFCCPCAMCCDTTEKENDDVPGLLTTLRGWLRRR